MKLDEVCGQLKEIAASCRDREYTLQVIDFLLETAKEAARNSPAIKGFELKRVNLALDAALGLLDGLE